MFGFAKKIGMTRFFQDGKAVATTVLEFPEQLILQRKTTDKEGYTAVQVASFQGKKPNKAILGHLKKHAETEQGFYCVEEFNVELSPDKKTIDISEFAIGDVLQVQGTTKGKGFTGAVKRYGFAGQPASRGHDHKRAVGSIGTRWPQRVIPGTKMAGQEGNVKRSVRGLKIVAIDNENKLIFVAGSVPGANGGYLKLNRINTK